MSMRLFSLYGLKTDESLATTLQQGFLVEARQEGMQQLQVSPPNNAQIVQVLHSVIAKPFQTQVFARPKPLELESCELGRLADETCGSHALRVKEFCNRVVAQARKVQDECPVRIGEHSFVTQTRTLLAQCILLLDKHPERLQNELTADDAGIKKAIEYHFSMMMQSAKESIQYVVDLKAKPGFFDVNNIKNTQVCSSVAVHLVTKKGFLNLGLAEAVVNALVSDEACKNRIFQFCDACNKSPRLRVLLEQTKAPSKEAQELVKASFTFELSDTARPICAHLCAHFCLPTNNTFAEAIRTHRPECVASDIRELLEQSQLWRTIDGQKVAFGLDLHENPDILEKACVINPLYASWQRVVDRILVLPSQRLFRAQVLCSIHTALLAVFPSKNPEDLEHRVISSVLQQLDQKIVGIFDANTRTLSLKNVADPAQFKKLVISSLDEFVTNKASEQLILIASKIYGFVQSDAFNVFWQTTYEEKLPEVLGAYFELPTEILQPQNAEELLLALIDRGKQEQRRTKFLSNTCITLSSPLFAFTLNVLHPSLKPILCDLNDTKTWFEEYQGRVKALVTKTALDHEIKTRIVHWMLKHYLCPGIAQSDNEKQANTSRVLHGVSGSCTLTEFRNAMLTVLYRAANAKMDQEKELIALKLDSFITKHALPDAILTKIGELTVFLAPNKELYKGQQMHLCCYPDPLTSRIRLGVISNDGKRLRPLDEKAWFCRKWLLCVRESTYHV